jgi:hypothetical protein
MHVHGLVLALSLGCTSAPATPTNFFHDILGRHVKDGRVDYKAIEAEEMPRLSAYLEGVAKAKMPEERNARIGFLADAYNALVIRSVIANGRPRSVLDVKGFFNEQKHTVAGQQVTLDELEKKVLNPFAQDPRTHFVLVCAAVGCPILESRSFAGSDMDQRMDEATRRYLSSPFGAQVGDGALKLSMIFQWYEADFGGAAGVLAFVKKHLPPEQAKRLGDAPKIEPIDYNWTLNQK